MNWYKKSGMDPVLKQELVELINRFVDRGGEINERILEDGTKEIETGVGNVWEYSSDPYELREALKEHLNRMTFVDAVMRTK